MKHPYYLGQATAELVRAIGSTDGYPGSGSAAALSASVAASLIISVGGITIDKSTGEDKKLRETYAPFRERAEEILTVARTIRGRCLTIVQDDAEAFADALAKRHNRDNEKDEEKKAQLRQVSLDLLQKAAKYPVEIAAIAIQLAGFAGDMIDRGYKSASGDSHLALALAIAAAYGSIRITQLNMRLLKANREWVDQQSRTITEQDARIRGYQDRHMKLS